MPFHRLSTDGRETFQSAMRGSAGDPLQRGYGVCGAKRPSYRAENGMPGFDIVVLLFIGMLGVILGLVGLAARPDSVGIVLGVMVLALGLVSVWQGWRMRRSAHGDSGTRL